jgi:predicted nucleic acid-binding protein
MDHPPSDARRHPEAIRIQRRYLIGWWDAMIVNSAIESGAEVLWTEDLNTGRKFGNLVVKNPFNE